MYQQHLRTLGQLKHNICPKIAILEDLAKEIIAWQEAGNMVIIATNFNEDIHSDTIQNYFAKFRLYKVCSMLHGPSLPATHNHGTLPIDGIFAPAALIPLCHASYLSFGKGVLSNHRAIWMDFPAGLLHLSHKEPLIKAPAHWLKCTD